MSKMTRAQKEAYEDDLRDALALIGNLVSKDDEAVKVILGNADAGRLLIATVNLLFDELARHGDDPAEWVASAQAMMRDLPAGTLPLDEPDDDPAGT